MGADRVRVAEQQAVALWLRLLLLRLLLYLRQPTQHSSVAFGHGQQVLNSADAASVRPGVPGHGDWTASRTRARQRARRLMLQMLVLVWVRRARLASTSRGGTEV